MLIVRRLRQIVKWRPLGRQEQDVCQEKYRIIIRRRILGIWMRNEGENERQRRSKRVEDGELESVKNGRKKERSFVKEEWKRCKQIELYRFEYLC